MSTPDDTRAGLGWPSKESTEGKLMLGAAAGLGWPREFPSAPTAESRTDTSTPLPATTATHHPEESA